MSQTGKHPSTGISLRINGVSHGVPGDRAHTTLLDHLREACRLTGTKEGCAEGDCGACMVLLETDCGVQPINACIRMLGTLDGASIVTVEGLSGRCSGGAHPAQEALIATRAAQCGFCTPGFAISLAALYENSGGVTGDGIRHALAGNLCRCTGYRAILQAAERLMSAADRPGTCIDETLSAGNSRTAASVPLIKATSSEWSSDNGRFILPIRIDELVSVYAARPDATLVAGGTDVVVDRNRLHGKAGDLIYIGAIDQLQTLTQTETEFRIGATAPLNRVFELLLTDYPEYTEYFRRFAAPPITRVATLGGNLANASPVGDMLPLLTSLDARLGLRGPQGQRELAIAEFFTGYRTTVLTAGEFLEKVVIPRRASGQIIGAYKVAKRFEQDTASVSAAFSVTLDGGYIRRARASFGGMSPYIQRAASIEALLNGKRWSEETVEAAAMAVPDAFMPLSDVRGDANFRSQVAANLLRKFYLAHAWPQEASLWREAQL